MAKLQKRSKVISRLNCSQDELVPVKIYRSVAPDEHDEAIVLQISQGWVLLAVLRDGGYFNGYTLVRLGNISRVVFSRTFLPFLRTQDFWPPANPWKSLDLAAEQAFLSRLAELNSVLSIHEEVREPDKLWIGTVDRWKKNSFWFHCIDPDGTWSETLIKVRYEHLTRVDVHDDYALVVKAVAGPRPAE
ncbi:hypothetical protein AUR04nite_16700 [Glutamicibacter uratoxydans]|uniref:Uncharacterized protein n=1 Tax=Glutamicibacter uratoxydans TaxID=43667 RepID=A0A4Y4DRZ2_GLUUR|nr:hypothetical protein [Glutamicibacter uratoxydans]GED06138.1 hypothetical protein AUR04nite_16700 [Glutamicibacter uratoxydans]